MKKEIISTDRHLSVKELADEIGWASRQEVDILIEWYQYVRSVLGLIGIAEVAQGPQSRFYLEYLPRHPELKELLVKYGFAQWFEFESEEMEGSK